MRAVPCLRGMEVATAQVAIALRPAGARRAVPHDPSGGTILVEQLQPRRPTLLGLEATGGLERLVPSALAMAGRPVVVVNPPQAREGAHATGPWAKLASEILGLREVVDEVGAPAILVGGCEAAVVPIALAARHPDRVRALIVVNGTARLVADAEYAGRPARGLWLDTTPLKGDWEGYFRRFLSEVAPMPWTDLDTLFGLLRSCVTGEALAAFFAGLLVDVRQVLAHIVAPTLVLHATDNEVIPFPQAQYMAAHIGGARVHALQGARHHIHPSYYNDEIARAVRDFLAVEGAGGSYLS